MAVTSELISFGASHPHPTTALRSPTIKKEDIDVTAHFAAIKSLLMEEIQLHAQEFYDYNLFHEEKVQIEHILRVPGQSPV